jgi:hypothetical protein
MWLSRQKMFALWRPANACNLPATLKFQCLFPNVAWALRSAPL